MTAQAGLSNRYPCGDQPAGGVGFDAALEVHAKRFSLSLAFDLDRRYQTVQGIEAGVKLAGLLLDTSQPPQGLEVGRAQLRRSTQSLGPHSFAQNKKKLAVRLELTLDHYHRIGPLLETNSQLTIGNESKKLL